MPSLIDRTTSNLDMSNYEPMDKPVTIAGTGPSSNLEPGLNIFLRCPMPPVWQTTPDSLRQFYQNSLVPQIRLFNPPTNIQGNGGTTVTNVSGSGSSSSSSSTTTTTLAVSQISIKTPLINPSNVYAGSFTFSKAFQLMTVTTSSACRIQLYGTKQTQLNDASRGLDVPPSAGTTQGIICDLALDTSPFTWQFQDRIGSNGDSPVSSTIYISVTNLDVIPDVVNITFEYVPIVT
jgi:hypothetical protein